MPKSSNRLRYPRQAKNRKRRQTPGNWLLLSIGLAVMALGFFAFFRIGNGEKASPLGSATPNPQEKKAVLMEDLAERTRHFKGDPDAPVTILEFSDFQ